MMLFAEWAHQRPKFNAIIKEREQFKNYIGRKLSDQHLVGNTFFELSKSFAVILMLIVEFLLKNLPFAVLKNRYQDTAMNCGRRDLI